MFELLHSSSVKKHEWPKYVHVKNCPVVSWRNPVWKLLLRDLTKASSFCYDCPSLGWYICRLIEFPVNGRVQLCVCAFVCELKGSWELYKSSFPPHPHHHLSTTIKETSECSTFTLAPVILPSWGRSWPRRMGFTLVSGYSECYSTSPERKGRKGKKINLPAADFLEYTEENTFVPKLYRSMYLTNNSHTLYFA